VLDARQLALAEKLDALARITIPPAFDFLGEAARYLVAYGGRGSAKSWSICRRLLREALWKPIRVLCCREIQLSIEESVHHLIESQIAELGLAHYFEVLEKRITSKAGAEFVFAGLRSNVAKIMSFEAIDRVWVEEAAAISHNSWEKLIPTIRRPGSQLLISFNPDLEDDPTYKRFIKSPPPDAIVRKVSWRDNPHFPEELRREKDYLSSVDPDAYEHVWEGACRSHSDAQVFKGKFAIEAFEPQDGWDGPYLGADFGFNDPTTLVSCRIGGRTLYVENEAYAVSCDIDRTPALFDEVPEARKQTIRADSSRPETISYLQQHGYPELVGVDKWPNSVEEGVQFLRQFERIVIHPRCEHVAAEFRLYSYKVDRLSGDVLPELQDKHNHCIDALRYALAPIIKGNTFAGWVEFAKQVAMREREEAQAPPPAPALPWHKPRAPMGANAMDPTGGLLESYRKAYVGAGGAYPGEVCAACGTAVVPGTKYIQAGRQAFHEACQARTH
jgi:phage terminase large subunit